MTSVFSDIFDFFLPRVCPACSRKLTPEEKCICSDCYSKIASAEKERIIAEYRRKFAGKNIISGFTSLFVFEKDKELQHVIHSVKYGQRYQNGIFLGRIMGIELSVTLNEWGINLIVPVPLHSLKKAERGYNQSEYIAKGLSRETNIPLSTGILKRTRYTQSQTTMNIEQRAANMADAFKVKHPKDAAEKRILLIDDVITTGATTSECGKVLLSAGAEKIYAASVAIAD
jgi:ComF family protein